MARVLVADDSATVRGLLHRQLVADGHEVIEAVDGREALDAARSTDPDVVLLDVRLPVLDGHQVLAELQRDDVLSVVPVVILSAEATSPEVWDMLNNGAHDELRKPFEPAELTARVAAAARVKSLQDQLRLRNIELDRLSRTDPLTGLYNRRHIDERLREIASASRRHGHAMAILMCDVDHFKAVNDSLGHGAGDGVLTAIATRLAGCVRAEDVLGRWGGEEFIVLCPFTDIEGAHRVAERVRRAVAASSVALVPHGDVPVTISVGIAAGADGDADELVTRADTALFEAKQAGRNQVGAAPD